MGDFKGFQRDKNSPIKYQPRPCLRRFRSVSSTAHFQPSAKSVQMNRFNCMNEGTKQIRNTEVNLTERTSAAFWYVWRFLSLLKKYEQVSHSGGGAHCFGKNYDKTAKLRSNHVSSLKIPCFTKYLTSKNMNQKLAPCQSKQSREKQQNGSFNTYLTATSAASKVPSVWFSCF